MSWARVKATGSGKLDFRLEIAGCPYEWTTSPRITHSSGADGRRVLPGLQYSGLKLSERAILKECWIDVSGITVKIKPCTPEEETLDAFTRTPEPVAYLAANGSINGLEVATTSIVLDSAATLAAGHYHLGSECIYTAGANAIQRAKWGTTAQRHMVSYGTTSAISVPVYAYPPTLEGRRATLYVYGAGDAGTGNGTAVWRGIVSRPPRLDSDGIGWTIQLDPVTKALEQRVAASEGLEYRIRGIYHSEKFPCRIAYYMGTFLASEPAPSAILPEKYIVGFFDTQEAFTAEVNANLAAAIVERAASLGSDSEIVDAVYSEAVKGPPTIACRTSDSLVTDYVLSSAGFFCASYLEGYCTPAVGSMQETDDTSNPSSRRSTQLGTAFGWGSLSSGYVQTVVEYFGDPQSEFITPLGKEHRNRPIFTYPLSPARAALGSVPVVLGAPPSTANTLYPADRLYLDLVDGIEVDDYLLVKNGESVIPILVTGIDTDDRYVTANIANGESVVWFDQYTKIIPARTVAIDASLDTFVSSVVSASINANDGDTAYITSGDLDTSRFAYVYAYSQIDDYWRHRSFIFVKPTPIKQIMSEEMKAAGLMLRLESDGRIGVTTLPLVTNNGASTTIEESRGDILLPARGQVGSWIRWEAQADGIANSINVRLAYSPINDDYDPRGDVTVRSISSIAEHKSNGKGQVEIAPKSTPFAGPTWQGLDFFGFNVDSALSGVPTAAVDAAAVSVWVSGYLRVLSMDYATVTISVPFKFFDLLIGDVVSITCSLIPNGQGGRGVTAARGAVVGREWGFDPAGNAMGTLTLYFPREVSSGYAPSANLTSWTNVAGLTWDVTASNGDQLNIMMSEGLDGDVAKHFSVNDKVLAVKRFDGVTPTTVAGTVTAKPSAHVLRISFNTTWVPGTPGTDYWTIQYQDDSGSLTDHQQGFTYVADALRQLYDGRYARRYL